MHASPDPVSEPDAYRTLLLDALGTDDPVEAMSATPDALRQLVDDAGPLLRAAPAPGDWSVIECVGHITDAELVASARGRWILAEDEPDIVGYDQDRWVARLRHVDDDPDDLLELFEALRRANLALMRRTTPEDAARVGNHRERGPESFDLTMRLIAGHDRIHLAQARRALDSVANR